jgi:hypothetical protein
MKALVTVLRNLQIRRIDLFAGEAHRQKSKTKGGVRSTQLGADAMEFVRQLRLVQKDLAQANPVTT